MQTLDEIENLVKIISKLPGLGPKSAKRIVLKLINNRDEIIKPMANTLAKVYKNVTRCNSCGSLKSNIDNHKLIFLKGRSQLMLNQYEKAASTFLDALAIKMDSDYLNGLGFAYSKLKRLGHDVNSINQSVLVFSKEAEANSIEEFSSNDSSICIISAPGESEITHENIPASELRVIVQRLRKRFTGLFHDLLKTQLVLKGIITIEDWDAIKSHIQYDFLKDGHFAELKNAELLKERLLLANEVTPYVGKYFSVEFLRKNVLRQTDEEIEEIDRQIASEVQDGMIADPLEGEEEESEIEKDILNKGENDE